VDWQTVCEAGPGECHYQVRLEGKWWDVPPTAVVQSGNRVGPTLVWPVYRRDNDIFILETAVSDLLPTENRAFSMA